MHKKSSVIRSSSCFKSIRNPISLQSKTRYHGASNSRCARIIYNSEYKKILIARKKSIFIFGGLWEFPGGKVEEYESYEMALKRELKEELNIEINSIQSYLSELYNSNGIYIHLHSFQCSYQSGEITLKDHDEVKWVEKSELSSYNFSPSDIHIVKNISSCL